MECNDEAFVVFFFFGTRTTHSLGVETLKIPVSRFRDQLGMARVCAPQLENIDLLRALMSSWLFQVELEIPRHTVSPGSVCLFISEQTVPANSGSRRS